MSIDITIPSRPLVEEFTLKEIKAGVLCLVDALLIIHMPDQWTNDPHKRGPAPYGPFCIMDALNQARPKGPFMGQDAGDVAYCYLKQECGTYPCVFNDDPKRTHEEVIILFGNALWQCALDEKHLRGLRFYRCMAWTGVALTLSGLLALWALS